MVKFFAPFVTLLLATASAASVPDGTWPTSTGTVQYPEAYVIKTGEVFDGKMQTFERSDVSCEGQTESGADTAVFKMEPGATLKNAIIGKNQMEGVHCDKHDCTIENVWWDDVCEDALSIKAELLQIDGFYGEDISKLYRSCGTCGDRPKKVSVSMYIVNPENAIVTVNKNWGDEATLSNIWVKSAGDKVKICQWSQGNADGEPSMLGDGPSPPLCQYSESDVHINGDVSQATGTSTSSSSTSTETQSSSTGSSATQTASTASSQESTGSVSTSAQIPTNSSTAASDSDAPGTVAPAGSNSNSEQTSVSTESSKTQQEETNEESNDETTQTQQSTISSNKNGDSDEAQNEEQTITSSSNDSTTSNASTSSTESSSADSTTQTSSAGSTTQASSTGATTQSSNAGSTAQTVIGVGGPGVSSE
ncbi:Pectin lyase fold [Phytophthora cactorum]|nr:Pectin lyase fold [Phytophthora cactorum]